MLCKEYTDLNIVESNVMLGEISHLIKNDSATFQTIASIIRQAKANGLLAGVTLMPQPLPDLQDDNFKELIN